MEDEKKAPVIMVEAPLRSGDVITDLFGRRYVIKDEAISWASHPVDFLKSILPSLDPVIEQQLRDYCDSPMTEKDYYVWKVHLFKKTWRKFWETLDIGNGKFDEESKNILCELSGMEIYQE